MHRKNPLEMVFVAFGLAACLAMTGCNPAPETESAQAPSPTAVPAELSTAVPAEMSTAAGADCAAKRRHG